MLAASGAAAALRFLVPRAGWPLQYDALPGAHATLLCPQALPHPHPACPADVLILLFTLTALLGLVGPGGGPHNQLAATRWGASLGALLGGSS